MTIALIIKEHQSCLLFITSGFIGILIILFDGQSKSQNLHLQQLPERSHLNPQMAQQPSL